MYFTAVMQVVDSSPLSSRETLARANREYAGMSPDYEGLKHHLLVDFHLLVRHLKDSRCRSCQPEDQRCEVDNSD